MCFPYFLTHGKMILSGLKKDAAAFVKKANIFKGGFFLQPRW